ncbi:MAG TPA: cysteine synthase A [Acidimicrobiales bacterium]|nr:cysteine synthase A [Acidimicrobiales bacterium]
MTVPAQLAAEVFAPSAPSCADIAGGIEDLIGGTPLLSLPVEGGAEGAQLLAKLECMNPLSSIKDRTALWMLRQAEDAGLLLPGGTVIEATSGNTGIALAALAASRGYRCIVVMPDNATCERRSLLATLGAEVELTPRELMFRGCVERALEIHASVPGSWYARQHENMANVDAHRHTTGPEIWAGTSGAVDVVVCGIGTGGTITGTSEFLKSKKPAVLAIGVEPAGSPLLSEGWAGPHAIPGLTGGFVAATTDRSVIDEVMTVTDEDALRTTRWLSRRRGLLVGISSGAAVHAASRVARRPSSAGCTIVCILPDTGERYLSILAAEESR